jgi:hypothetical protein
MTRLNAIFLILSAMSSTQGKALALNPTNEPTFQPTVSAQPTTACAAGNHIDAQGICLSCGEGQYTDKPNQQSCEPCEPWTLNRHDGNSACEYVTTRNAISKEYPIAACVLYVSLSFACYGLSISLGVHPATFLTIALITTDQVTDILYVWYSLFANLPLLCLSAFFCIANLVVPMIYILWYTRVSDLFVYKWLGLCADAYEAYDLNYGDYYGDYQPKYGGWVFHSAHGWRYGQMFPFGPLLYLIDILWIVVRIFIMSVIIVVATTLQLVLLLIGVVFYVTKLMSIPSVNQWFWTLWNPDYLFTHPQVSADDSTVVYNTLILLEVFSECIPQIAIQVINTVLILGKDPNTWPALTLLSICISLSMIVSILYHFWYNHRDLIRDDPNYRQFDFRRIPRFDLYEKTLLLFANHRTLERIKNEARRHAEQENQNNRNGLEMRRVSQRTFSCRLIFSAARPQKQIYSSREEVSLFDTTKSERSDVRISNTEIVHTSLGRDSDS